VLAVLFSAVLFYSPAAFSGGCAFAFGTFT
jgi:hypothetical protein